MFRRAEKKLPVEAALRWHIYLTTIETVLSGIFLLHARSLENNSLLGGYSLPRLLLLGVWAIMLGFCVWILVATLYKTAVYKSLVNGWSQFIESMQWYSQVRGWITVFAFVNLGSAGLFFFQPDFWFFLWPSSLVLLKQYFPVLVIGGVWAIQSLLLMRSVENFPSKLPERSENPRAVAVLVFLLAFSIYVSTFVSLELSSYSRIAIFPDLADAFLKGRLDIVDPISTKDLSLYNGKYYVSFPPLAALLMMPVVAWKGSAAINPVLWNNFVAALGVTFIFLTLEELRLLGWSSLKRKTNVLLALFFGFGTVQYFMAIRGPVYYISQILTATFLSLSLLIVLKEKENKERAGALLLGITFGAALLARPNIAFAALALIAVKSQKLYDSGTLSRKKLFVWVTLFSMPIVAVIVGLLWYNQARFGSFFDFGYRYMLVVDHELVNALAEYGQFHPHFFWRNFFDNFLRLPYWDQKCHVLAPNWRGMSIFIGSPLIIYLYRAFKSKPWIVGTWLSIGLILLTHLLYFNSGALQFGYRFSLDFMPLVLLLLATTFREKMTKKSLVLLAASIVINYIGVLWIARQWCENW